MTTSDRSELLKFEEGIQKEMIRLVNGIFIKLGRRITEYKRGIPIVCIPIVIGYKEVENQCLYSIPITERNILNDTDKPNRRL